LGIDILQWLSMRPLECLQSAFECCHHDQLPLWELSFHGWDQATGRHFIAGQEFEALNSLEQNYALDEDVCIVGEVACKYHFAGVSIPDAYWEIAPGVPSYYWLPDWARLEFASRLDRVAGRDVMLIAASGGVVSLILNPLPLPMLCNQNYSELFNPTKEK